MVDDVEAIAAASVSGFFFLLFATPLAYAYYLYDDEETEKCDHPEDFDDPDGRSFLQFLRDNYEDWQAIRHDRHQQKLRELRRGGVRPK